MVEAHHRTPGASGLSAEAASAAKVDAKGAQGP
jgi:hypothetical protein